MAVYCKFKSSKDCFSVPMADPFISLTDLKERICSSQRYGHGKDFDLLLSDAQSGQEYTGENYLIPRNTTVVIRRIPGVPCKPILAPLKTEASNGDVSKTNTSADLSETNPHAVVSSRLVSQGPSDFDDFGELYDCPTANQLKSHSKDMDDEDARIRNLIENSSLDKQSVDRHDRPSIAAKPVNGRRLGWGPLERKTPPAGYVCYRCREPGHFIQHCPTNGDPDYNIKRTAPAVVPLIGSDRALEIVPTTSVNAVDLPGELNCPICKMVMKDAVLTSKCCFNSFCDSCIRNYLISKSACICGAKNILTDDLIPNRTLRDTISRLTGSGLRTVTTSSGKSSTVIDAPNCGDETGVKERHRFLKAAPPKYASSSTNVDEERSTMTEGVKPSEAADSDSPNKMLPASKSKTAAIMETVASLKGDALLAQPDTLQVTTKKQKLPTDQQGEKRKKRRRNPLESVDTMQQQNLSVINAEHNYGGDPANLAIYNPYWAYDAFSNYLPQFNYQAELYAGAGYAGNFPSASNGGALAWQQQFPGMHLRPSFQHDAASANNGSSVPQRGGARNKVARHGVTQPPSGGVARSSIQSRHRHFQGTWRA